MGARVPFEPHETIAVVACGKGFVLSPLMLENPAFQIAGDSDV
jgi:hypothetical protein